MIKNLMIYLENNPDKFLKTIHIGIVPFLFNFLKYCIENIKKFIKARNYKKNRLFNERFDLQIILNEITDNINNYIENSYIINESWFSKQKELYANIHDYPELINNLNIYFRVDKIESINLKNLLLLKKEKVKYTILLQSVFDLYNTLVSNMQNYNNYLSDLDKIFYNSNSYADVGPKLDYQYNLYLKINHGIYDFIKLIYMNIQDLEILVDIIYETNNFNLWNKTNIEQYFEKYDSFKTIF